MDLTPDSRSPSPVYLRDYRPADFRIETVDLQFELDPAQTRVTARLCLERAASAAADAPLVLHGEHLELLALELDGRVLAATDYRLTAEGLCIDRVPERCELRIVTSIRPQDNTELSGLYTSSGNFCTQCEAEGFRRITYFLDRPDVMARYSTTISAERERYPVLLSNGNLVAQGEGENGRHWARWEDPFPKPSYLFALVAGTLACIEDEFVTASGRTVQLFIYVQQHNLDKCGHAMQSLKKAMRWDEEVYGREYDLDRFMIVAVDDFNMGAMENKGLNVFNSKFVLARPDTATDQDYQNIEGIIGHEYFHNWSGNRVTCRDWFQLSLKEGFTVFRDQEFSADMGSRAVQRIQDVNQLRTHQFREDAGPMAHPVRPDSYVEINNFYTATVYNKGAEVVRMLRTLLGAEGFRRGTDLYFQRHDGQAVTTEDFLRAIEDANGVQLQQFRHWYTQAGTPAVQVERHYDATARTFALTLMQQCPATPGQPDKLPFHIPVALALLGRDGQELPLRLYGERAAQTGTRILQLCQVQDTFVFQDIDSEPVPSLLRDFSAPIRIDVDYCDEELGFLLAHDRDPFCRWEAGQQLAVRLLLKLTQAWQAGEALRVPEDFIAAVRAVLVAQDVDSAFKALALSLPSETYLAESMRAVDPQALHAARQFLRQCLARELRDDWLSVYRRLDDTGANNGVYALDAQSLGRRSLRNLCLSYLMELADERAMLDLALEQFQEARNMTDTLAALSALAQREEVLAEQCLDTFYARWQADPLVLDKWFAVQAMSRRADTLARVRALSAHPAFSLKNPNKVYALLRSFAQGNPARFHGMDGAGYLFMRDQLAQLDDINPQVAARLAGVFNDWRRYTEPYRSAMREVLLALRDKPTLSRDLGEIVNKSLAE
ncbi:MAG: aminopeptidase N [Gammaproteobacteria bacterium]|nr:aminopeptidase N [Gammaproteobacteria bacterium]